MAAATLSTQTGISKRPAPTCRRRAAASAEAVSGARSKALLGRRSAASSIGRLDDNICGGGPRRVLQPRSAARVERDAIDVVPHAGRRQRSQVGADRHPCDQRRIIPMAMVVIIAVVVVIAGRPVPGRGMMMRRPGVRGRPMRGRPVRGQLARAAGSGAVRRQLGRSATGSAAIRRKLARPRASGRPGAARRSRARRPGVHWRTAAS